MNNKNKKFLIVTGIYPPEIGGPATYARLLKNFLEEKGENVDVAMFRVSRKYPKGIRHIHFTFLLLRKIISSKYIFVQDTLSVGLPTMIACFVLRRKYVLRIPGDYVWEQARQRWGVTDDIEVFQTKKYGKKIELLKKLERLVAKRATRVIVPSKYFASVISKWGVREGKMEVVYNGVPKIDESLYDNIPKKPKTIISSGRFVPWKNFGVLIQVISKMPDWTLHLVGDGPERESLEKLAREMDVSERVVFTGTLPQTDLYRYIKESMYFVLPTKFESFSFQIVEAMMLGTPVLASRVSNLEEIIRDGQNGVFINPDDPESIKSAIFSLEENSQKREDISSSAKKDSEFFSFEKTGEKIINIFEKI